MPCPPFCVFIKKKTTHPSICSANKRASYFLSVFISPNISQVLFFHSVPSSCGSIPLPNTAASASIHNIIPNLQHFKESLVKLSGQDNEAALALVSVKAVQNESKVPAPWRPVSSPNREAHMRTRGVKAISICENKGHTLGASRAKSFRKKKTNRVPRASLYCPLPDFLLSQINSLIVGAMSIAYTSTYASVLVIIFLLFLHWHCLRSHIKICHLNL